MSGRTDWLTEFAKPVADKMARRAGSLKHVLSAGVLALDSLSPDLRDVFMAMAVGEEILDGKLTLDFDAELYNRDENILLPSKKAFRREVMSILQDYGVRLEPPAKAKKRQKRSKTRSSKSG